MSHAFSHFALVILDRVSPFAQVSLYHNSIYASHSSLDDRCVPLHSQFSVLLGSHKFCQGWPRTMILPLSDYHVPEYRQEPSASPSHLNFVLLKPLRLWHCFLLWCIQVSCFLRLGIWRAESESTFQQLVLKNKYYWNN